jgi:hypothetical protein
VTLPAILIIPILMYSQFEGRFFPEPYLWLMLGLLYSARHLDKSQAVPASDGSALPAAVPVVPHRDGDELTDPVRSAQGRGSESI